MKIENKYNFIYPIFDARIESCASELAVYQDDDEKKVYCFSPNVKIDDDIANGFEKNSILCFGKFFQNAKKICQDKNIQFFSFSDSEKFTLENAKLTAEAVLSIMISQTKKSVFNQKILIVGFGRIGSSLARLLTRLGVEFSLCTSAKKYAEAFAEKIIDYNDLQLEEFETIINTAPTQIISDNKLKNIPFDTAHKMTFVDVASIPSINLELAVSLGINGALYPALPAKFSPSTAGKLMAEYIKEVLGELK